MESASAAHTVYRERLLAIYETYAPTKAHQVDALLTKYRGREEALIAAAAHKYVVEHREEADGAPAGQTSSTPSAVVQSPPVVPSQTSSILSARERLQRLYAKYTPKRVPFVDRDLGKYPGREEDVVRAAVRKYGPEPEAPSATETAAGERATAPEPDRAVSAESQRQTPENADLTDPAASDYKARVMNLYEQHAPQRLPRVEHELLKYKGKEEALIRAIMKRYGVTAEPASPRTAEQSPECELSTDLGRTVVATPLVKLTDEEREAPHAVLAKPPPSPPLPQLTAQEVQPPRSPAASPLSVVPAELPPADAPPDATECSNAEPPSAATHEGDRTVDEPMAFAEVQCATESAQQQLCGPIKSEEETVLAETEPRVATPPAAPDVCASDAQILTESLHDAAGQEEPQEKTPALPPAIVTTGETAQWDTDISPLRASPIRPAPDGASLRGTPGVADTVSAPAETRATQDSAGPLDGAGQRLEQTPPRGRSVSSGRAGALLFPAPLLHDVFHMLGSATLGGTEVVDRSICLLLLEQAFGFQGVGPDDSCEPASCSMASLLATYLTDELVSEKQFAGLVNAFGAARLWGEREMAYHVRHCEAFVRRCENTLFPPAQSLRLALPSARASESLHTAADRELRSGFWLYYCVFPCVVPSWKRSWAFLCAPAKREGVAAELTDDGRPSVQFSRLSICFPNSTRVDLSIPFRKLTTCCLEAVDASLCGGTLPGAYRKHGLLLGLMGGASPLTVQVCSEQARHCNGIVRAYHAWQKRESASHSAPTGLPPGTGTPGQSPSSGIGATPPSSLHYGPSATNSAGESRVPETVVQQLTWTHVWVARGGGGKRRPPQPSLWASFNGLLLHTKTASKGPAAMPSVAAAQVRCWDLGSDARDVVAVGETPVPQPSSSSAAGGRTAFYAFAVELKEDSDCLYCWTSDRSERSRLVSQLKRLVLRRKLFGRLEASPDATEIEGAVALFPSLSPTKL